MESRRVVLALGAALALLNMSSVDAFGSLPQTDGTTTRCWAIAQTPTVKQPSESYLVKDAEGVGCPFKVRFSLPAAAMVNEKLSVTWTISYSSAAIATNTLGYKLPLNTLIEPVTGQPVQILHSNIHACKYSAASICDPFVDADKVRDHTPNQPGNFSVGTNESTFVYGDLSFPEKGDIFVLAHLALPGPNATFRYDFAVYRRISILEGAAPTTAASATVAPAPKATEAAQSHTVVYIVAIGGAVLVVIVIAALCIFRRRRGSPHADHPHHVQSPYPVQSAVGYTPLDHEGGSAPGRYKGTQSTGGRPTVTGTADTDAPWEYSAGGAPHQNRTGSVPGGGSTTGSGFSTGSASAAGLTRADEEMLQHWRLDENQVVAGHMLSRGAFGEVWKGEYRGTTVAVKKLLANRGGPEAMRTFVAEILLMAKLDSKFIVKFIGVAWFRKAEMMLVVEYMDLGDLRSKLESTTPESFPLEDKIDCALSVVEGLVYLHTLDTSIIHRDIKSRNVLLDSVKGTKLTDFGVSRESTSETMTIGIGTYRWMAPEILSESHYTQAADIYSFGVILSELDMHIVPYSDQVTVKGNPINDTAIMGRVMQGSIKPTFSSLFPPALLQLAKECLAFEPEYRPTALAVAYRLGQIRKFQNRQSTPSGFV